MRLGAQVDGFRRRARASPTPARSRPTSSCSASASTPNSRAGRRRRHRRSARAAPIQRRPAPADERRRCVGGGRLLPTRFHLVVAPAGPHRARHGRQQAGPGGGHQHRRRLRHVPGRGRHRHHQGVRHRGRPHRADRARGHATPASSTSPPRSRHDRRAGYFPGAEPITVKLLAERGTGGCSAGRSSAATGRQAHRTFATALTAGMTAAEVAISICRYAPPVSPVWDPVQIAARRATALGEALVTTEPSGFQPPVPRHLGSRPLRLLCDLGQSGNGTCHGQVRRAQ